ncbi:MAG: ComEA family DNA-binding protein [Pseudomonadota bacterium]
MKHLLRYLAIGTLSLFASIAWAASVDINTADAVTLSEGIYGVGEKRAEAIINYRDEHGPFSSVEELTQVSGIGNKLLDRNRENLTASQPE